jgi:hypothetical protein
MTAGERHHIALIVVAVGVAGDCRNRLTCLLVGVDTSCSKLTFAGSSPITTLSRVRERLEVELSEDFPGSAVSIPSGLSQSLSFPPDKDT